MNLKLFIDDKRFAPPQYEHFKTAEDFYLWLENHSETSVRLLSLDYFLDDETVFHETGLHIAKKLTKIPHRIEHIQIHSAYYEGGKAIYDLLSEYQQSNKNPYFKGCKPSQMILLENGRFKFGRSFI